jgi:hypothetical protein
VLRGRIIVSRRSALLGPIIESRMFARHSAVDLTAPLPLEPSS